MATKSLISILAQIRKLFIPRSPLFPYLSFLKQNVDQKQIRLSADSSAVKKGDLQSSKYSRTERFKRFIFQKKNHCWNPCARGLLVWYFFVMLAIIYIFFFSSLVIGFGLLSLQYDFQNDALFSLVVVSLFILLADVFIKFQSGFIFRGMIVTQRARVYSTYLRSMFFFDVVLIILVIALCASQNYYISYPIFLFSVTKFVRMFEMDEFFLRRLSVNRAAKTLYVIGKQFITIFVLSHIISIPFYLMDYAFLNTFCAGANSSFCWLNSSTAWNNIINQPWYIQYFYALYWGVNTITTISYGDVAANNPYQVIYVTLAMCFGFIVYAYIVNNIIKILLWANAIRDQFRFDFIIHTTYMANLRIPKEMQYQIRDQLEYLYLNQKNRNLQLEEEMQAKLPDQLRTQLLKGAYTSFFKSLDFFIKDDALSSKMLFYLTQHRYSTDECILHQGYMVEKFIFIFKGPIQFSCNYRGNDYKLCEFEIQQKNSKLIVQAAGILAQKSLYSVIPKGNTVIYSMPFDSINQQANKSGALKQKLQFLKYEVLMNQNLAAVSQKCFYCQGNHIWHKCKKNFATFNDVRLNKMTSRTPKQKRLVFARQHIYSRKKEVQSLSELNSSSVRQTLYLIHHKMKRLQQMFQQQKEGFDVDIGHDWNTYIPEGNFSRLKLQWNKNRSQKKTMGNLQRVMSQRMSFRVSGRMQSFKQ